MPSIVIKPDRDLDLYVYWSTVVDAPVAWGDRAWMLQHLIDDWRSRSGQAPDLMSEPAGRLDRADIHGTSAIRWDDEALTYEQRGALPRRHLARAVELLDEDREPEVWDLLEPFEEGMEVRRG